MTAAILATTFVMATMAPPIDGPAQQGPQQSERPRIAQMFNKADLNNDGVIDRQEFGQAVKKLFRQRGDIDRRGRGDGWRGRGHRGEGRRGEQRRGQEWREQMCPDGPQAFCRDGSPGRGPCFDQPRGRKGASGFKGMRGRGAGRSAFDGHNRRGRRGFGGERGPMFNRGQAWAPRGAGSQRPKQIERMIKDAVAEALQEAHGIPMKAKQRFGQKGKQRGPAPQGQRDCGKNPPPADCDPANCGDQVRRRDGAGRGDRGPRGDRAQRFQKLDRDGDGVITLEEFNAAPDRAGIDKDDAPPQKQDRPRGEQRRRGGRGQGRGGPDR